MDSETVRPETFGFTAKELMDLVTIKLAPPSKSGGEINAPNAICMESNCLRQRSKEGDKSNSTFPHLRKLINTSDTDRILARKRIENVIRAHGCDVFLTKNPTIPPTWTESEFYRAKIGCIAFVQNQLHDDVFRQVSGHTELYEL